MSESFNVVETVKEGLGMAGGDHFDAVLKLYIDDVKRFMISAGVNRAVVDSKGSAGVIVRGVSDLWNYGSGEGKLSPYFVQAVIQLVYEGNPVDEPIQSPL